MIQLEQSPSVKLIPFKASFMAGAVEGIKRLAVRGMSLGLVLFLALGTLKLLNHGASYLAVSMKKFSEKKEMKNQAAFQALLPKSVTGGVRVSAYEQKRAPIREKAPDMAETLRESRYFLSSLESFSRSFSRLAR